MNHYQHSSQNKSNLTITVYQLKRNYTYNSRVFTLTIAYTRYWFRRNIFLSMARETLKSSEEKKKRKITRPYRIAFASRLTFLCFGNRHVCMLPTFICSYIRTPLTHTLTHSWNEQRRKHTKHTPKRDSIQMEVATLERERVSSATFMQSHHEHSVCESM